MPGMDSTVPTASSPRTTQSSRVAGYSTSRQSTAAPYQGR